MSRISNKPKHIYDGTYDDDCLVEEHTYGRIGRLTGQGETTKISVRRNATNVTVSSDRDI